jgi:hypothetical protein
MRRSGKRKNGQRGRKAADCRWVVGRRNLHQCETNNGIVVEEVCEEAIVCHYRTILTVRRLQ